jgi:hypothetical protein
MGRVSVLAFMKYWYLIIATFTLDID